MLICCCESVFYGNAKVLKNFHADWSCQWKQDSTNCGENPSLSGKDGRKMNWNKKRLVIICVAIILSLIATAQAAYTEYEIIQRKVTEC